MSGPRVSIHIITYNQASFITETLTTALEQNYDNLQVVVGDDASTDGSQDIIRDFAARYPSRLLPLLGEKNLGITANANRVLRRCDGELIALQGGDDVILPGKIAAQVEWFAHHRDHSVSYHDVDVFDSDTGRVLYRYGERYPMLEGDASTVIREGTFFAATAVMVRASSMPAGGFDSRIAVASDWLFFIECLAGGGRIGALPGVLARHRRHSGNTTRQRDETRHEEWETLAVLEEKYPHLRAAVRQRRADLYFLDSVRALRRGRPLAAIENGARSLALSRGRWTSPRLLWRELRFAARNRSARPAAN
jgi:glycosyltransferase involved in cell wall biosynthesis